MRRSSVPRWQALATGTGTDARCMAVTRENVWTGDRDGRVVVRNLGGDVRHSVKREGAVVWCIADAGGVRVWAGMSDGHIMVFNAVSCDVEAELPPPASINNTGGVLVLCHHLDSVFAGYGNALIMRWTASPPFTVLRQYRGHSDAVRCLVVRGTALLSGSDDAVIAVWDISEERQVAEWMGHQGPVRCMASTPRHVWSGGEDGVLYIWQPDQGYLVQKLDLHTGPVTSLLFSGGRMWSASWDGTLGIWNTSNLALVDHVRGGSEGSGVMSICEVRKASVINLWASTSDQVLRVWEVEGAAQKSEESSHKRNMEMYQQMYLDSCDQLHDLKQQLKDWEKKIRRATALEDERRELLRACEGSLATLRDVVSVDGDPWESRDGEVDVFRLAKALCDHSVEARRALRQSRNEVTSLRDDCLAFKDWMDSAKRDLARQVDAREQWEREAARLSEQRTRARAKVAATIAGLTATGTARVRFRKWVAWALARRAVRRGLGVIAQQSIMHRRAQCYYGWMQLVRQRRTANRSNRRAMDAILRTTTRGLLQTCFTRWLHFVQRIRLHEEAERKALAAAQLTLAEMGRGTAVPIHKSSVGGEDFDDDREDSDIDDALHGAGSRLTLRGRDPVVLEGVNYVQSSHSLHFDSRHSLLDDRGDHPVRHAPRTVLVGQESFATHHTQSGSGGSWAVRDAGDGSGGMPLEGVQSSLSVNEVPVEHITLLEAGATLQRLRSSGSLSGGGRSRSSSITAPPKTQRQRLREAQRVLGVVISSTHSGLIRVYYRKLALYPRLTHQRRKRQAAALLLGRSTDTMLLGLYFRKLFRYARKRERKRRREDIALLLMKGTEHGRLLSGFSLWRRWMQERVGERKQRALRRGVMGGLAGHFRQTLLARAYGRWYRFYLVGKVVTSAERAIRDAEFRAEERVTLVRENAELELREMDAALKASQEEARRAHSEMELRGFIISTRDQLLRKVFTQHEILTHGPLSLHPGDGAGQLATHVSGLEQTIEALRVVNRWILRHLVTNSEKLSLGYPASS